jgi:hypothetical protein
MGWEDRDWARWTPDERKRYLGQRDTAPRRNPGEASSGWNQKLSLGEALTYGVGSVLLFLGLAWVGIGPNVFHRHSGSRPLSIPYAPTAGVNPNQQHRLICTQRTYDPATQTWRCTAVYSVDGYTASAPE